MICDCQLGHFNCETRVRCFLEGNRDSSGTALDELIEKVRPLIWGVVNRRLRSTQWWQDRGDVVQEVIAKLCNPSKIRTWLNEQERGRGAPFCHWVAPVAVNCVNDWLKKQRPVSSFPPGFEEQDRVASQDGLTEQAARLRQTIRSVLAEFELEWRLVYCMKFSYFEPAIADIADAQDIANETVHFRVKRIHKSIAARYSEPISPELARVALTGTRHPVEGFEQLQKPEKTRLNASIIQLLKDRPAKEQFAFYARYSPLALNHDTIAEQVGEERGTVCAWLRRIESQIGRLLDAERRSPGLE